MPDDPAREIVRHALATLAYRASKAVRGAPASFGDFRIGPTSRTPAEILAHMSDVMEWALTMAQGKEEWRNGAPRAWTSDVDRLFNSITALDRYLAGGAAVEHAALLQLFQGPIADALTHTGQLAMLRRLVNAPVRGEDYPRAPISAGRTGLEQSKPTFEFD
jgi:hypothetical protein